MPAPVLLLHGVPADAALWTDMARHLPHDRVLAPSLPGYGGGPGLQPPTVDAHTRWVARWLEEQAITGPVHVVGQDYGGLLGARLTIEHPHRVCSLTLISAPVGLGWAWPRIGALPGLHLLFYRAFGGGLWHHQGVRPHRRAAFAEAFGHHRADPTLPDRMRAMARGIGFRMLLRTPGELGRTGVPLLTLQGTSDRFVSWQSALYRAARHRKGGAPARTVLLRGGRHYLPFGLPQHTAEALARFHDTVEQTPGA